MLDGDDNEASDVNDAVHYDDPADEIDLANVFKPYTQRDRDEWHAFCDNFAARMWQEYQSSRAHRTI